MLKIINLIGESDISFIKIKTPRYLKSDLMAGPPNMIR